MGKESQESERKPRESDRKEQTAPRTGLIWKRHEAGVGLPAAMTAAPWNRISREHERNLRGARREATGVEDYCCLISSTYLGGKKKNRKGVGLAPRFMEESRNMERWACDGEQMVSPAEITLLPSCLQKVGLPWITTV